MHEQPRTASHPPSRREVGPAALVLALLMSACGKAPAAVDLPELVPGPSPFEYPVSLWDSQVDGTTELMVHVSTAGTVDSVYVDRGSGYPAFDSAAVAGARALRFSPGRRDQEPVAAWARVPVRFSPDSASVNLHAPGGQEAP